MIRRVAVDSGSAPVSVRVADTRNPNAIEAVVYRFSDPETIEAELGQITAGQGDVLLGTPDEITGRLFLVDGFVLPFGDDPPAPFEIVVSVCQDGRVIDSVTASDRGTGAIGSVAVRFRHPFEIARQ